MSYFWNRDTSVSASERENEQAFLARQRAPVAGADDGASRPGSWRRTYPDNLRPKQKEVDPAQSTGRPAQAI